MVRRLRAARLTKLTYLTKEAPAANEITRSVAFADPH